VGLRVHLKQHVKPPGVDLQGLKRFAKAVLRGEDVTEGGLTIVLTDNEGIREFNSRFRGRDAATDVLSFPLHEADESGMYLGDVIVSVEQAKRQAGRFHNDPETELARVVSHGILHILGYDHHTSVDGRRMKSAERKALAVLTPGTLWPGGGEETA
jgi:probable rRNA maturation factor